MQSSPFPQRGRLRANNRPAPPRDATRWRKAAKLFAADDLGPPIGAKLWSISQTRPVWDSHRTANQLGWFGVNSSAVLWQSQTGRGPGWPLRLGITSQLRLSHAVGQSGEQCQSAQGHEAAGLSRMSHDVASGPLKATMFLVPQPPPLSV